MNGGPFYFDLQVNGYGGVDFNSDDLTADALHRACEKLENDGVGGILATIITEKLDLMTARLRRLVELRENDDLAKRMIAGIHVEGPFINETTGYLGAHPADAVIPADCETAKRLMDACGGLLRIVTLAPERDPGFAVTRMLAAAGIIVSAGHTDASLDALRAACDVGLQMFTHVGNGCPMTGMHRHDNIIQRALHLREHLWLCFIADQVHVPSVALKNYLDLAGDRAIVVTDAMAPAGLGPGRYKLGRWDLLIGDDMVARAPDGSHFVGAAITMAQSHANLRDRLGLDESQCRTLLADNPRRSMGL
ncbi:MAG: N-acetylglucosamine-6-phosphate deacetylase [Tepidisphaeraceae bacterium]